MSLRLKTILGVGLIEAVLLVILISSVLNYMQRINEESLENYVHTTTTLFATTTKDAVLSYDLASLETFIEEILKNQGVLYTRILDSNNNVLASGGNEKYLERDFLADQHYQEVNDNIYDAEALITVDGVEYGRIQMGISTSRLKEAIDEARQLAASIAAIEMLLVGLFSFGLGIYLTGQLKVLRVSAKKVAEGNLDHKIVINSRDEVGEVAHAFNKMTTSLQEANEKTLEYQDELLELNRSLEERVERRTHKILEQKEKLEAAYDQLQHTQKQLVQSEKMASIGQLAAGVAHEINNPIAFVKSNLSSLDNYVKSYIALIEKQQSLLKILKDNPANDVEKHITDIEEFYEEEDIDFISEDIETLLKESLDGTNRVQEIVKGLKIYSRASDEVMEECNINQCIEDTLKMLNNEIKYACEVVTELDDIPSIPCDRSKLAQVFTNLIVNAIHAMEENGVLSIETLFKDEQVIIKISDTGKGIPQEHLSKLFDPFFTTKPVGEGTGLGLSISQGIIEDHGGHIEVESEVGIGTSFIIFLPSSQPSSSQ